MRTEVKTRITTTRAGEPRLVMEINLVPRGSGNRAAARRLAHQARTNEKLRPFVTRVVCGASKVTVHMRSSLELLRVLAEWETAPPDVPGQLLLPGVSG